MLRSQFSLDPGHDDKQSRRNGTRKCLQICRSLAPFHLSSFICKVLHAHIRLPRPKLVVCFEQCSPLHNHLFDPSDPSLSALIRSGWWMRLLTEGVEDNSPSRSCCTVIYTSWLSTSLTICAWLRSCCSLSRSSDTSFLRYFKDS